MTYHWTAEQKADFTRLWNEGVPVEEIQRHFGCSQQTMDGLRARLGLPSRAKRGWTEEEQVVVRARWAKGDSASMIAADMPGRSRNSVIGLVYRLGLTAAGRAEPSRPQGIRAIRIRAPKVPRSHIRPPKPGPQNKPAVVFGAMPSPIKVGGGRVYHMKDSVPLPKLADIESPNAKPWQDRQFGECNWPVGGRYEIRSCCNPVHARGWCAGHFAIGTAEAQPKPLRPRDARGFARFDRVEKDRPVAANSDRTVWDDARLDAA